MFEKMSDLDLAMAIQKTTQDLLKVMDLINAINKEIELRKSKIKVEEK